MEQKIAHSLVGLADAAEFGEAVRHFRKERGLTQQQVADMAGCSLMYVSSLERGKEGAELGKALKILDALDIEVSFTERRSV